MDKLAPSDEDVMKEVMKRDEEARVKANDERAAREAEKARKLIETALTSSAELDGKDSDKKSKQKNTKKEKKKALAAASGLSFDAEE